MTTRATIAADTLAAERALDALDRKVRAARGTNLLLGLDEAAEFVAQMRRLAGYARQYHQTLLPSPPSATTRSVHDHDPC